jgi:hypothetical protein
MTLGISCLPSLTFVFRIRRVFIKEMDWVRGRQYHFSILADQNKLSSSPILPPPLCLSNLWDERQTHPPSSTPLKSLTKSFTASPLALILCPSKPLISWSSGGTLLICEIHELSPVNYDLVINSFNFYSGSWRECQLMLQGHKQLSKIRKHKVSVAQWSHLKVFEPKTC